MHSSQGIQVHKRFLEFKFFLMNVEYIKHYIELIVFCSSSRLIVVAEKEIVYSKFPIPLINRLEKHFLNISTMLSEVQVQLAQNLNKWAEQFIRIPTITFRRFLLFPLLFNRQNLIFSSPGSLR